ncbi:DUF3391 domain-containing protein [Litoribacillus peritrichatus]|uniref:DUF3391 domain-containing protein n=1 Tax=Litoribacillus peritrichatus TaxID=718191 RepID=A0ABP7N486_9GAMM
MASKTSSALQRYSVDQLKVGMYISSLDVPICNTPFPVEGFYICTEDDILKLSKFCRSAEVNIKKSAFVQQCHSVLQLEVVDLPKAITTGYNAAAQQAQKRYKKQPKKPSRVKNLLGLGMIALVMWYFI